MFKQNATVPFSRIVNSANTWLLIILVNFLAVANGKGQTSGSNTIVTNGQVDIVVPCGKMVYVGGSFSYVSPLTGGLAALDSAGTFAAVAPRILGTVRSICPDGVGGYYVGGQFSVV